MREVVIVIRCDACDDGIEEEVEGASSVLFTVRGEKRELDLCDNCIGGTFLQEARPVKGKRKTENTFTCSCGKSFPTERGLRQHRSRVDHG